MKDKIKWHLATVRRAIDIYLKHDMHVYAGYATFYFMMSIIPLMMMVISLINMIPWFSVNDISAFLMRIMPDVPQMRSAMLSIIINLNHQSGQFTAYLFAFTSLWSGSHGVFSLMSALERINRTKGKAIHERPKAILYTVLFTLLIPSMLVFQVLRTSIESGITSLFNYLSVPNVGRYINNILKLSGIVTLAFMILAVVLTFTFLPSGRRKVKKQLPGSIFTSVFWIMFTKVFSYVIKNLWRYSSIYGTLAAVFLSAMWLNIIIMSLLFGASLNRAIQVRVTKDLST